MPEALKQKALQWALKQGRYDLTKIAHIFSMERNPL